MCLGTQFEGEGFWSATIQAGSLHPRQSGRVIVSPCSISKSRISRDGGIGYVEHKSNIFHSDVIGIRTDVDEQTVTFFVNGVKVSEKLQLCVSRGMAWVPFVSTCSSSVSFTIIPNLDVPRKILVSDSSMELGELEPAAPWDQVEMDEMMDNQGKGLLHEDDSREVWDEILKGLAQGREEEAEKILHGAHPAPGQWDEKVPPTQAKAAIATLKCLFNTSDALLSGSSGACAADGPWMSAIRRREVSRRRCQDATRTAEIQRAEAEKAAALLEAALRARDALARGPGAFGDFSAAVAATREATRLDGAVQAAQARVWEADVGRSEAEAALARRRREAAAAEASAAETHGAGLSRAARVYGAMVGAAARGSAACPTIEVVAGVDAQSGPRIRLWSRPKAGAAGEAGREREARVYYTLDGSTPTRQVAGRPWPVGGVERLRHSETEGETIPAYACMVYLCCRIDICDSIYLCYMRQHIAYATAYIYAVA